MYFVYILGSKKNKALYFGSTQSLEKRLQEHNAGLSASTKPHRPWQIIWYGVFETKSEALQFEKYLKSGSGKAFAYKRLIPTYLKQKFSK